MGISDELQKLDQLRQSGALTDDEFARAKSSLLAASGSHTATSSALEKQLAEIRLQNDLMQLDHAWERERRRYLVAGRFGRRYVPTAGTGVMTALVGGIAGAGWTAAMLTLVNILSQFDVTIRSMTILVTILPALGIVIGGLSLVRGLYLCLVAQNYKVASNTFKNRQSALVDQYSSATKTVKAVQDSLNRA